MPEYLWKDRKRTFLGLPWSFTRYALNENRFFIKKGFFNLVEDEVRLYRITDVRLVRTLGQRIFGLGTIQCSSFDKSLGDFEIRNIKKPEDVKEMLSNLIQEERIKNRTSIRETVVDEDDDYDQDDLQND